MPQSTTELDDLLGKVIASEGATKEANQYHACFLRSAFFLPIKETEVESPEEFEPLFIVHDGSPFVVCFDTYERFKDWAGDNINAMGVVEILGRELIDGLGLDVYLSLNVGTEFYKEFAPDEVMRLKKAVAKTKPPSEQLS